MLLRLPIAHFDFSPYHTAGVVEIKVEPALGRNIINMYVCVPKACRFSVFVFQRDALGRRSQVSYLCV